MTAATAPASFSTRDLISALFVVLIWGTNFVAMKVGLRDLTPFQMGAARYIFAVLPLILFVRPPKMAAKWLLLYGLCQGVGQFGLLFLSLKVGMSASLASVLLQTQVFFTALFGAALLGETAGRALQAGMLLAALGLACFGMNYLRADGVDATTPAGLALCLGGAAMWAASNIVVRRARRAAPQFDVIPFMVWSSLVPVVPFMLLSLAFDAPQTRWQWLAAPWTMWTALAYLGWMATIVGYAMWTGLLKRHSANRVAPFGLAVPVVGVTAGMLCLNDKISVWQWVGIALIVSALVCVMFGQRCVGAAAKSAG